METKRPDQFQLSARGSDTKMPLPESPHPFSLSRLNQKDLGHHNISGFVFFGSKLGAFFSKFQRVVRANDSHRAARRYPVLVAGLATLRVAAAHGSLSSSEALEGFR